MRIKALLVDTFPPDVVGEFTVNLAAEPGGNREVNVGGLLEEPESAALDIFVTPLGLCVDESGHLRALRALTATVTLDNVGTLSYNHLS